LRKYSPVSVINRKCNKDYLIPNTNVIIEKGTLVAIPIHAMQNDPYYFPEPERFHPERFADEETQERTRYIFLPFGDGPRQCIGKLLVEIL
jgi:cytochrome P450 family 6